MYIHVHVYTYTCTCIYIYMYMYIHIHIHVYNYIHVHVYACTCIDGYDLKSMCMYTDIDMHIHTYSYSSSLTPSFSPLLLSPPLLSSPLLSSPLLSSADAHRARSWWGHRAARYWRLTSPHRKWRYVCVHVYTYAQVHVYQLSYHIDPVCVLSVWSFVVSPNSVTVFTLPLLCLIKGIMLKTLTTVVYKYL